MSESFDAIIIGAGQAGPPLAGRLTDKGMTVALVERKLFGGTCVNTGCMPTKTLVASAYAAHLARRAADFGVTIGGPVGVDMKALKARKDAVVEKSRRGVHDWLTGMKTCTVIEGQARFESSTTVRVGQRVLSSSRIFVNVGGRAIIPDLPGLRAIEPLTNTTILDLEILPRHLVVIGGSYIALEFAQMYRRFGSEVTVLEKGPRLTAREDEDISVAIRGILENEGIAIHTGVNGMTFARAGADVTVGWEGGTATASHVLAATGRQPNTDDLGLDAAGVTLDAHGYVTVDDELRTNVPGIWAMGDCNGRGAFTHTSYNDYEIVAANLLDGDPRRVSDRITAYALYIDPPLGRVGMTEAEARKTGKKLRIGTRPMTRVGRAVEKGETQGFMKVIVDADTDAILGAAILGTGGDEAIHGFLDVMYAKAPSSTLSRSVPIHPTLSELIPTMLESMKP